MTGFRLRTKFLLLFSIISLVPLVLTAVLTYQRFQGSLQQDATKLEIQLASTAAVKIKSFIVSQVQILDSVATLHDPQFLSKPKDAEKIVENVLYKSENFTDIDIVDKDGKETLRQDTLIVYTPQDYRDLRDTEAFKSVKEKGLYVGPMHVEGGKVLFTLGRWIADSQGNFSGAVFAQVDGRVMQEVTNNISALAGGGGRAFLVNKNGTVVAHPDLSYVLGEKDLSALPTVSSIVSGKSDIEVSKIYINEKGEDVLGSAYPINLEPTDLKIPTPLPINWYVIVEQQRSVIFAQAGKVALFSGIIFLLVVVLAILAAVFVSRRISSPIESLYTATQEFGKGNLLYRTKIRANDEIGDLARNFNDMAKTISKSITDLKQEEKIISAERDKLSIILSGITNAVIAVDLDRNIILFNKAAEALTGLKAKAVLGKPIEKTVKIFDQDRQLPKEEYCPIQSFNAMSEGIIFQKNNLKLQDSRGEEREVNVIAGTINQGLSIHLGCILTFQDITRELVIEKTKSEFVSIAAHQLRTPLTGIKWSLVDLFNGSSGPLLPNQKKMLGQAVSATRRMIDLVNNLLDVSRIEEGRFGISLTKQSLMPSLKLMQDTYAAAAEKKGIKLVFNLPAELPAVNIDKEKIEILLNNLLDNAIKYSPVGATVKLEAQVLSGELKISVKDSGIGIPEAELDRVFSKFFRSSQALLYHTSGSGLGLYVSKNIVEQHGGKIWFESKENQGSTFYFSLPLAG